MVIAVVLLTFSFINLVIEPVQEADMTPQKIYMKPITSWPWQYKGAPGFESRTGGPGGGGRHPRA